MTVPRETPRETPRGFAAGETRFGAPAGPLATPATVITVLRAQAAANGLALRAPSSVDRVAAAVGADAWCLVTRAHSLAQPATYGPAAVAVLGAVLRRAAGQRRSDEPVVLSENCATDPDVLAAADDYAAWARQHLGADARQALLLAARDLCVAGPDNPFAALAEVLRISADTLGDELAD